MSATSLDLSQIKTDALSSASTFRTLIGLSTADTPTFKSLTLTSGTITTNVPVWDATATWNNAATTFTGLRLNITDTASNAASLLMDLQVGGSSRFKITKGGVATLSNQLKLDNLEASNVIRLGTAVDLASSGLTLHTISQYIRWTNFFAGSTDLSIYKDAADTLAQRRSTNPQTFRIYNTFTDASNYERGKLEWASNVLRIGTEKAGTGSARALELQTDGVTRLTIAGNGLLSFHGSKWQVPISGAGDGNLYAPNTGKVIFYDQTGVLYGDASGSNYHMIYEGWSGHRFSISNNTPTPTPFRFTDGTFNPLTASTEMSSVNWNLATTKTFATGNITTQRAFRIQAPTYAFVGASTITTASTLSISGSPIAGANSTITNAFALNVESGVSNFGGNLLLVDAINIAVGTTTGTKIGTATTQKLGFYNATPVVQPAAVADATDAASVITQLNLLLGRMRDLGLIAT